MGRPKQFDPDAAVAAAMHLFWRHGYGAATPAALVDTLGIGKGSLYNTFASKQALFTRALRRYGDERLARLAEALGRPGPVRPRLQAALERLAAPEHAKLRRRGCLAVNAVAEVGDRDAAAAALARDLFERLERAFQAVLEEGQRSGEIDAGHDARALAGLLVATLLGMTVIARAAARPAQLAALARAVVALV